MPNDAHTIHPGDLVWVAHPTRCCGHDIPAHGDHFVVSDLVQLPDVVQCQYCNCLLKNIVFAFGSRGGGIPLDMLEKVPPLNETERMGEVRHA